MKFFKKLAHRVAYHVLHPLLRFWRVYLSPARDSARVLLVCKNEVLLVRNIGVKRWSLPGGMIEKGETPEECALRELREELNITSPSIDHRLGTYRGLHHGTEVLVHIFVAKTISLYHKKQWEIDRAGWFTLNALPPNLSPATARRIGEYKSGRQNIENEVW
jgi:8-oxo-dGTP pyrophosphatase MutT (NUDIX family)